MSKELVETLREIAPTTADGSKSWCVVAADLLESQAREIEELKNALYVSSAQLFESQHKAIGLRAEVEHLRIGYESATMLVAQMHEAAVGKVIGPHHGVVEDVANIRAALVVAVDALKDVIRAHNYESGTPVEALTRCNEALK